MARSIFVNLPVKDLNKTVEFFTKMGFTFNAQFTDEKATAMVVSEHQTVMLLTQEFFKTFINKDIADATKVTEVIVAMSVDSREEVDELLKKAMDAGAKEHMPANDHGFMYQVSFQDLDGHQWEIFYMDPKFIQG